MSIELSHSSAHRTANESTISSAILCSPGVSYCPTVAPTDDTAVCAAVCPPVVFPFEATDCAAVETAHSSAELVTDIAAISCAVIAAEGRPVCSANEAAEQTTDRRSVAAAD